MTKSSLTLVTAPEDFFRELVTDAMGKQRVSAQPETEFYLVNLLNQFMKTERLYKTDADGNPIEEPLALMVKEALEQEQLLIQQKIFRHVGDVSLYVAGYFPDSLRRKLVDLDYYIDMGETAYKHVAARSEENVLRATYQELADKFARFVEVLADVSEKTTPKSESDLLKLYERWSRTGSEQAARALREAGIEPVTTPGKKNLQ